MSPDGFHVAYVFYTSHRPGRNGLYVVDLGRGKPQRVAAGNARNIAWSPDSTEIAFSGQSSGKRPGIFVVSSTGGAARRVFPANGFPNWSPDGRQIVCSCGFREEVWVFSSDGEGARRLAGPVPRKVAAAAVFGVTGASWSPDGRLIAFGRNCYLIEIVSDIWCEPAVMDPDGKNKRTVRKETTFFAGYPPVWSSPGSMLLQTWRLRAKPVMSLNVRTGARRVFYAVRSTVYQYALWASTRHTAFATVDGTKLVLLDPSGRVLGKRRLPRPLVFKYGYFPFNGDVWLGETR